MTHVDKYAIPSATFMTGVMEYILNGESDLLDWMCDEFYTDSERINDLMFSIDVIQHTCTRQIEMIGYHYDRVPTTFSVHSVELIMTPPCFKLYVQDWRG